MIFDKLTMELAADQGRVRREMNCGIMCREGRNKNECDGKSAPGNGE